MAQVIVQMLVDAGATHVFGGHGGAVIPLIEAIEAHPKIQVRYPTPSHAPLPLNIAACPNALVLVRHPLVVGKAVLCTVCVCVCVCVYPPPPPPPPPHFSLSPFLCLYR